MENRVPLLVYIVKIYFLLALLLVHNEVTKVVIYISYGDVQEVTRITLGVDAAFSFFE